VIRHKYIISFISVYFYTMDLGEVEWGDVDWIGLAQNRNRWRALVNSVLDLRGSMKCGETIEWPLE
jgi:hypothetical protein